ncbi:hypothetical protein [Clostridium botulinum]|uniref:hypothetical protein n=1 Tax=Clostridium botulinum TaxID=1491 RepID=UPI0004D9B22F|nr:hypothetical protein [Clostridium botulinum]KEH93242.1 hypothetical protein Z963_02570 [Clostridium botulinum C/D str. It1]
MKIDIQEIVNSKIKDMEEKKIVEKTIEDTLEKTIIQAVTNALDGYKLRNLIEDKVGKEVSEVVSQIGFTAYNGFIAEKVKQITEDVCNKDISDKIQKTFNEILIVKRDNVKLSEICEKYREHICEVVDESEKYDLEDFYVSVENGKAPYNWITFKFAKEKNKYRSYGDQEIEFTVHRNEDGKTGWIGTVYIDGHNLQESMDFGTMSDIERLIVNIAYNKTPIIIDIEDEDDIDNSFDIDY